MGPTVRAGGRRVVGVAPRGRTAAVDPRHLQIALGTLWIVDGALQLQPSMFRRGFVTAVLLPSATGSPSFVGHPLAVVARLLEPHIAAWNALFAVIQLVIGIGLLLRRSVRAALTACVVWSLAVWWLGEGLGGLRSGSASPLTGAPGAALLYALAALLLWPGRDTPSPGGTVGGLLGDVGARVAWAMLWIGSAALLCQPANLSAGALRTTLTGAAAGEPGWLSRVLVQLGRAVGGGSTVMVVALAVVMAVAGAGVALKWREPALLGLAMAVGVLIWVLGEAFGGVLTGSGTDPSSGPLLVLIALALYPVRATRTVGLGEMVPALSGVGA